MVTSHPLQATGVTVFRITRGMDAGPVVAQCGTSIEPHETAGDLLSRLAESGSSVLVRAMQAVDAGRVSVCCCAVSGFCPFMLSCWSGMGTIPRLLNRDLLNHDSLNRDSIMD